LAKKLTKMNTLTNSKIKSQYLQKGQTKNLHPNFFNLTQEHEEKKQIRIKDTAQKFTKIIGEKLFEKTKNLQLKNFKDNLKKGKRLPLS
jgi:hypothetical protein